MKKIKLSIFFFQMVSLVNAQGISGNELINLKSPQSYAFEKYGNVPVNMYTGAIDLKIPITEFKAGEKQIPIFISYDSSGFVPHKKSDPAGINWALMAGGRITRQLNKKPDEYDGIMQPNKPGWGYNRDCAGFLAGVKANPSNNVAAYNVNGGTGFFDFSEWEFGPTSKPYETHPDVFNFNAPGISGKFIVGNDGNILVESDDPNIKVDLSQMAIYNYADYCIPPPSIIKIKDGEGNEYIFGGDMSTYEVNYPYAKGTSTEDFMPVINSFSLSKIILNSGKTIDFNYYIDNFPDNFCELGTTIGTKTFPNGLLISMESHLQQGLSSDLSKNCGINDNGFLCGQTGSNLVFSDTKLSFVKKSVLLGIKFGDYEVKFNYKDIGYPIRQESGPISPYYIYNNDDEWVLDNIITYNKLSVVARTNFVYSNFGGTYQRPFLTSLKKVKTDQDIDQEYSFEYYDTNFLPAYFTRGIDHWGYWNGQDNNTSITPFNSNSYNIDTGDYTLTNTIRDPDPTKYRTALLSKITYPTKGYTEYEYEPHYYNKRIERNSSSLFLPALTDNSGMTGGARIKKIKNFDNTGVISSQKEYQYVTSLNGSVSSGILMHWPRYQYFYKISTSGLYSTWLRVTSSNVQTTSLDSYNVGYSKVFEKEIGKGHSEYLFSNYETNPDNYTSDFNNTVLLPPYTGSQSENDIVPLNLWKNSNLRGIDNSTLRGKLVTQKIYSESNLVNPIKIIEMDYTNNIDYNPSSLLDNNKYVSINVISGFRVQGIKKYMNSPRLKKKTIKEYLGGAEMKTTTEYLYNSANHLNLASELTSYSDNTEQKISYEYATDLRQYYNQIGNHYLPYQASPLMVSKNMSGIPLVTTNYKNNVFQNRTQTVYGYDSVTDLVLPKRSLNYYEDELLSLPSGNGNGTVILPSAADRFNEITYDQYDSKGNLLKYTTKSGASTIIVWGYNQTQPIAKIEGKDAATFFSMFNTDLAVLSTSSNSDINAATELEFQNKLDLFQKRQFLLDVQITTYTHDPLIGIKSITPPSGVREVYLYDSANRLMEVREHNQTGKLLKEFKYNYKN